MHETEIAPYGAMLYAATTPKEWKRLRRKISPGIPKRPRALGRTEFLGRGHETTFIIWIDVAAHPDLRGAVTTAAHEAVHACTHLLDHVGEEYAGRSSEALAYLVDWMTGWLYDLVAPHYT